MYIWSNYFFFFFKQKTAYEMRISDWSSDVCSSDLSIHAGLWTSAALNAPPQNVPVLRTRLTALEAKFGFDPKGHTGKALTHALTQLPHDLVTAFTPDSLETLALTSMRSEEHTSELQSLMRISYAVFCLKKKKEKTAELQT